MSHEIRTPLNAVLGFAQILKGMESDLDKRFYLESILNSGKSLLKLLNDILDLSKVEAGKLDLQYAPVTMSSIFEDLSTIFAKDVADKELTYSVELHGFSKPLIIDPNRLSQILMNLVSNALKFTPKGFIRVSAECVFVNEFENLADITISVKDSGIGIDEKDHDEVFGVFKQSRGQKVADYGGTGLKCGVCSF
jgi:signal transduction histidine kinase